MFAKSSNNLRDFPRLKIPFSFSEGEQAYFRVPDVRFAGFGPLFGGSLVLVGTMAMVGIGAICFRRWRPWAGEASHQIWWWWTVVTMTSLLVSLVIVGEGWWARYVPHFYLFPMVIVLLGLCSFQPKLIRWVSVTTLFVLGLNIVLICGAYVPFQIRAAREINEQLRELKKSSNEMSLVISIGHFPANRLRLREENLVFEEREELTCENPQGLRFSETSFCLLPR